MPKAEPQRTCLGCRENKEQHDLLRFVLAPDRSLVPDPQRKLPGRGAYTCFSAACLRAAIEKRQFARSFKGEVKTGSADVMIGTLRDLFAERILSYLSLANKAGKVVSGTDQVLDAFRKGTPELLVLADDTSEESAERFVAAARKAGVEMYRLLDKGRIGAALGKEQRTAAVILHSGFVISLRQELTRYRDLFEGGAW